jgi:hypothetical protein
MTNFIGGILWVVGLLLAGSTASDNTQQMFISAIGLTLFFIGTIIITKGANNADNQ